MTNPMVCISYRVPHGYGAAICKSTGSQTWARITMLPSSRSQCPYLQQTGNERRRMQRKRRPNHLANGGAEPWRRVFSRTRPISAKKECEDQAKATRSAYR